VALECLDLAFETTRIIFEVGFDLGSMLERGPVLNALLRNTISKQTLAASSGTNSAGATARAGPVIQGFQNSLKFRRRGNDVGGARPSRTKRCEAIRSNWPLIAD